MGSAFVVRVEDLDTPRVVPDSEARILDDLAWLGLDADEGPREGGPHAPYSQGARTSRYETALAHLAARGDTYPCDCSRAEIARVASAPHAGEELVYPGTCREKDPARVMKRPPAMRLRVPEGEAVAFLDGAAGETAQNIGEVVGDFVLRRGDGIFAYQLAVIVDDVEMRITDVVRGDDLLASAPRQIFLARLLGVEAPRYVHLPLVVGADGARLAKRTAGASVRALREAGITSREIVGVLGCALGLVPSGEPRSAREVADASASREIAWPRAPWRIPEAWALSAADASRSPRLDR